MKVGLFFGSSTGNTARAASRIRELLGDVVSVCKNIKETSPDEFVSCDGLILGVSTWEEGQMQEHFKDFASEIEKMDLTGKTVALFGLGDQQGYSGRFQDALGTLHKLVRRGGAKVVGTWPREGYRYATSTAIIEEQFVGLALDDDCQKHMTEERIQRWVELIRPHFA